ncbi:rRNA accumulation- protein [Coemansia thaxteri]|uniref:rRNA accumulation- protein n=1 Tax=Coemansia thaxteri TaxID=2663907 RepID=A0A9W8BF99_9FUNG|nr:rRNA accumulation- protein [Coemansia thaxteri]KAJ2009814.1 rRNA accumulation- protein [Coemansia thaxteri]KAJ2474128.1 rRNA accumulation- protein [Coemansia sp. RSA 2322]KAJ2486195.1 rRNA accumulation- protein [Coemansia sp. RSA 2320]
MAPASQQQIHPNKEAFIEGVDHILSRWTALELAVQGDWGDGNTKEKREDMVDEIVAFFDDAVRRKVKPEPLELEDILMAIMSDDFNISLEDDSEKEVAAILCVIFDECKVGNFATVDKLADERDAREAQGVGNQAVQSSQTVGRPDADEIAQGEDSGSEMESGSEGDSEDGSEDDSDEEMEED